MKFRENTPADPSTFAAVTSVGSSPPKDWVVRGADGTRSNRVERFSGADALVRSLKFAHDEYSRVRWLME